MRRALPVGEGVKENGIGSKLIEKGSFMRISLFGRTGIYSLHRKMALLMLFLVSVAPVVVQAQTNNSENQKITVQILDSEGNLVDGGYLMFRGAEQSEVEFEVTGKGTISFSPSDFDLQEIYRVAFENLDEEIVYLSDGWKFKPEDYSLEFDAKQQVNKFSIAPQFRDSGQSHQSEKDKTIMEYSSNKTPNSAWVEPTTISVPKYLFAIQVPFLFGSNWTTSDEALLGVPESSLGWQFVGSYRYGFPEDPGSGGESISFRELSLAYAFNKYTVQQFLDPNDTADVSFLRVTAAYSFGKMSSNLKTHYTYGLALSYGGIFDGSSTLEYLGRTYNLFGAGAQGKFNYQILQTGGVDMGLQGQLELMYYPADSSENDFWYGLSPSFSLGVIFY